jgi:rRNA maturation endonuclease Nob1
MDTGELINLFRSADEPETEECKPCRQCMFELRAKDKFCRRCGSRQFEFVNRKVPQQTSARRPSVVHVK